MSSFFRTGETSSSDYTETESDEEQQTQAQQTKQKNVRSLVESSDDDDSTRVVKSQKDRIFEACQQLCDKIVKFIKVDEIAKGLEVFKQLTQIITKASSIFSKTGFPQIVIKTVTVILLLLKDVTVSQLDVTNQKAVKELIMNIDKFKKSYAKQFEAGNKALQPKSSLFAGSSEDDEDDEEDEDEYDDETEEDEELTDEELTEDDDDDNADDDIDLSKLVGKITREFWVKKPSTQGTKLSATEQAKLDAEEKEKQRQLKQQQRQAAALSKKDDLIGEDGQAITRTEKRRLEALKARANETITPEIMAKKLREIVAARGKRSTEIPAIIQELIFLREKSEDAVSTLRIQTLLTLFHFDHYVKPHQSMQISHWRESHGQISDILQTLKAHSKTVRLVEDDTVDDSAFSTIDFDEDVETAYQDGATDIEAQKAWFEQRKLALQEAKQKALKEQQLQQSQVESGTSSVTFVEGLQNCDYHSSTEFVNRLKEQSKLLDLFHQSYQYYLDIDKPRLAKRVAELILQYLYFYYHEEQDIMLHPEAISTPTEVTKWAEIVLSSDEPRSRIKALLYQLYAAAIHNKYEFAKERLAMSYLVDSINELDIHTRILYNRTLAQIGLTAFRYGDYKGCISYLGDLFNRSLRTKELIAQAAMQRSSSDGSQQSKDDPDFLEAKSRVYPYHQHINFEYLEAAHLISAMIVEIPIISEQGFTSSRRIHSKTFRVHYQRFLDRTSSLNITPSVDSSRDAILVSAHAISQGNWSKAFDLITKEIKTLWTSNPKQSPLIKEKLMNGIKVAALKAYLLTNGTVYSSVSLSTLIEMFQLPEKTIQQIINTQAYNEIIHAAWDNNTNPTTQSTTTPEDVKADPILLISSSTNQISHRVATAYVDRLSATNALLEKIQTTRR